MPEIKRAARQATPLGTNGTANSILYQKTLNVLLIYLYKLFNV